MSATRSGVTVIPVVVHVVWKKDSQSISDQQIRSQIEVLNMDYRSANTDLNKIPAPFAPLAGDTRIEFELATLDPSGKPTTGITRTKTTIDVFDGTDASNDADPVKSAGTGMEPWPRDRYLNMWDCQLGFGTTGTLGYSTLPGAPAELDGVVIRHNMFGTTGTTRAPIRNTSPTAVRMGTSMKYAGFSRVSCSPGFENPIFSRGRLGTSNGAHARLEQIWKLHEARICSIKSKGPPVSMAGPHFSRYEV